MEFWFLVAILPFFFALIFAFVIFLRLVVPLYFPLVFAISAFASVLASSFVQQFLSSLRFSAWLEGLSFAFFQSFIYSALIEELFKIVFLYVTFWGIASISKNGVNTLGIKRLSDKNGEISLEPILFFSMFFCATFAGFENVAYFVYEPNIVLGRLFGPSLLHILLSFFYIGLFAKSRWMFFCAIALPIFFHGSYNFFLLLGKSLLSTLFLVLLIFLGISRVLKEKRGLK